MLTFLCSPKPFTHEAAWNQLNALRSWRDIGPDVEIFIYGAPVGAREAAAEVGAVIVPEVECSPSGAPSFNAMVAHARMCGRHDLQVYANCDMLFDASLLRAMQQVRSRFERFLLVGERLDLAQGAQSDVRDAAWRARLALLASDGRLTAHGATGADYFGFVRGMWEALPPVYMGRAICDQALLHYCLRARIPLVSTTLAVIAVHQYHGYGHVAGGEREVFTGADTAMMTKAHALKHGLPTIADAEWQLKAGPRLERKPRGFLRTVELKVRYQYRLPRVALGLRALQYVRGKRAVAPKVLPASVILDAWRRYSVEAEPETAVRRTGAELSGPGGAGCE